MYSILQAASLTTADNPMDEKGGVMGLLSGAEKTQVRVNAALDMIDQGADELRTRFCVAYAIGYIDALCDERLISVDGAQLYREDAYARRRVRLAALGVEWADDSPSHL
jgi:hypothetical protein